MTNCTCGYGGQHEPTNTRCDLYIEMVDPIEITRVLGPIQRFWTCSLCCALVRDDYQDAHRMWHANAALETQSPQESQ